MSTTPRTRRPAAKPKKTTPARRATARYSREYPVTGGHDYFVRSIPTKTWDAVERRAELEGRRSIRVIAIKLLERYAAEGADVFGGWKADDAETGR